MINALRVFRAESKLLMVAMEVFVKEPTIDWLQSAQRLNFFTDQNITPLSDDSAWEPASRLIVAEKKLNGAHPIECIQEDLETGIMHA